VSKPSEVISYIEGGLGIAQGLLAAVDEGLGVCLNLCNDEVAKKELGLPDTAKILWLMTVGYPAEVPQVASQSPRRDFEELFFLGKYGNPLPRDEGVVEKLKKAKMIWLKEP
jgi:nitroreductase